MDAESKAENASRRRRSLRAVGRRAHGVVVATSKAEAASAVALSSAVEGSAVLRTSISSSASLSPTTAGGRLPLRSVELGNEVEYINETAEM